MRARGRSLALFTALLLFATPAWAQNAIVTENQLAGSPPTEWQIGGAGDLSIQGFATDISVNRGETVHFKIKTDAASYHIDIYRLGYYQGNGARHVSTGVITATLPQTQPADLHDDATGLTDCGNWSESAHWDVPGDAVSGIYLAKLTRDDTQGASHIVFVVRDDASHSDLLVQTSDGTWQAYNVYGGGSFYTGSTTYPNGHAAKLSYNRPFLTANGGGGGGADEDWLFNAEYPMVRWLEANGYDVAYASQVDSDRRGALIQNHKVFLSVGHDEYWSAGARANVTAARDAGVNLAFFSGNEIYWKTRYEASTDGTDTPYRTLVCYKEGTLGENACGTKCDPLAGTWTGLWRDGCPPDYPANDGCAPENALSGQISWDGTTGAIQVPDSYKDLRFWRNTAVANLGTGATATLTAGTLGYEWDWQQYPEAAPAGRVFLSRTSLDGRQHRLSIYRHASGALVFGAGTVQWSWGLDGEHARGNSTPDASMQQATVNLLADMQAQPATLQPGLVAATASTDATAPTSILVAPADGDSAHVGSLVTVSGTAADAGGGVVAAVEVSFDGGATWAQATGTTSWTYAWIPSAEGPANLRTRSVDDSGNLETPGTGITVLVGAPGPALCPCTLFAPSDTPASPALTDNQPIEVGVKFRPTVDGFITGLRFYKGSLNTGTHVGHLWTAAGTQLAEATYTGETASGWQEVTLTTPVAVTAGVTYVASTHSSGYYADTHPYFTTAVVRPPLRGLADGEDGPNGVYAYGEGAFPTSTFNSSNYWVDVVFNTTIGPDVTPPTVVATSPGNGAGGIAISSTISATFSEAIDPATVTAGGLETGITFELRDAANAPVTASVSYNTVTRVATLTPAAPLVYSSAYTVTLHGGASDPRVKDVAGNALASDVSWTFTTSAPPGPPPTEGPGGPILVISAAVNPFSRYLAEVLRTEGLNEFTAMDLSLVTPAVLSAYDVVVLGETPLDASQVTMLGDWTNAGGTLIAMRPDKQLAGLLGLTDNGATLANQYLLVDNSSGPGSGIVGQTIQFHGTADLYALNGATAVATLYADAVTATTYPAVTQKSVGTSGGQAIAFTYDLARSIVYTRQGNPAWAGQERDGVTPKRSDDMFYGNASFDPEPDWIDLNKASIPQADEQQRLLANLILTGNLHKKPLPRFWYLPKGKKAAVIMTGDDHGDAGMAPRFDIYLSESPSGCSVDDWECVRATGYEYVGSGFTDAQAKTYHDQGFEVAVHVLTDCADWTPASLDQRITDQLAGFSATFPSLPLPVTNRTHCIAWSDWSSEPEVESAHGIRLDTNYYFWPPAWVQDHPGLFTGSGMPMRFAKLDGTMIDCYQAVTQMTDESGQSFPMTIDSLLTRALDARGYYGAFCANMHFDQQNHPGSNAIVASALAHGVPVVSAKQMLDWLDGRNGSSFGNIAWSANTLSFTVAVGAGARNLQGMLPVVAAIGSLTGLTRDGTPIAYTRETIKGIEYALFPATAGSYAAHYAADTTPPVISAVTATPRDDGTATVTWTTDEASDSRVDYGTAPDQLTLQATASVLVTSHSLGLASLSPSTVYYYRVTSTDAATNAATSPDLSSSPASFTTPAPVCFRDQTQADFAAGTPDASTYVSGFDDGEVILAPAAGSEFGGATLPSGWTPTIWNTGGTATVGAGALNLDGAMLATNTLYTTGSVEFVATFSAVANEHAGWGTDLNGPPWAIFSTKDGTGLYARTNTGSETNTLIAGSWLGAPHRFRIDRTTTSIDYSIDGALVASHALTIAQGMRALASDLFPGGAVLSVDWIHVTPYASSGSFTSRVFDSQGTANWGTASWTADTPSGTSVSLSVRRGNSPVPDTTWTSFVALANGGTVGGTSRYLQYRADLASSSPDVTPMLRDVHVACASGPDATPPVISSVIATPDPTGTTATISWATDESADSRVDYGTNPSSLSSSVSDAALVSSHSLPLTGLSPGITYYYRVSSADASHNSASSPVPPATSSFSTPAVPCPADAVAADFAAGTLDANTTIAFEGNGEIILNPASVTEFSGTTLPAGWQSSPWTTGGTATVSGGALTVDNARAGTTASFGPGCSMEFVATFRAEKFQHIGFVTDMDFNSPWAIVSTGSLGDAVYARASGGGQVLLSAALLGSPHRYRIDWNASNFVFYVDGTQAATITQTVATNMLAVMSDNQPTGIGLTLDWLRVTPYASAGTFLSRVFDQHGPTNWGAISWTADVPANTALNLSVRTGDTPTPDASWSAFGGMTNGGTVGGNSRYLQYRADLGTSNAGWTPALRDIAVACTSGPDVTAPVISNVAAAPAADGTSATITWSTDEPADSRVDYGASAANLASSVTQTTRTLAHSLLLPSLSPGVTYYYRVSSADAASNASTDPSSPAAPRTFFTPAPTCFQDQTTADFQAGTSTNTYVSTTTDGEVTLLPASGTEFAGSALPASWQSAAWAAGGTAVVSGGNLTVDGDRAATVASFGPNRSVEFVATFTGAPFEHVGFVNDMSFGSPWAIFSTASSGTGVYARSSNGTQTLISTGLLNGPHRYRIDWNATGFVFFVDGAQVTTISQTVTTNMLAIVSDNNVGGPSLRVDWLRVSPYASSGSFASRIYDGGGPTSWVSASWNAALPAGTAVALAVRGGDVAVPDGTWTPYQAVATSGGSVGICARYVQYRADLTTSDATVTPALQDVALTCAPTAGAGGTIASLAATAGTGNDASGLAKIRLTWTTTSGGATQIYRKAYGDYPLFRTGVGAQPTVPATPAAALAQGWTLTSVSTSGQTDLPPTRDYWSYVGFQVDACGHSSAPSALAQMPNYLLGDVSNGSTACQGNNVVNTADLSLLGGHYGAALAGAGDPFACLDVAPTTDFSTHGRPVPDQVLDFEDLVIYALDWTGGSGPAAPASVAKADGSHAAATNGLTLRIPALPGVGGEFEVGLEATAAGNAQALSAKLAFDAAVLEPLGVDAGELLSRQGTPYALLTPGAGQVDVALLGAGYALAGEGELARVRFRVKAAANPGLGIREVVARDAQNQKLVWGASAPPVAESLPTRTGMDAAFPNPFTHQASLQLSLAQSGPASVAIYDLAGRRVRTLLDGVQPAGRTTLVWDGRNDAGVRLGSGYYVIKLAAGGLTQKHSVLLLH